jgi:hypothetical protein
MYWYTLAVRLVLSLLDAGTVNYRHCRLFGAVRLGIDACLVLVAVTLEMLVLARMVLVKTTQVRRS